ncbi:uncharacterized protein Eint_050150 [Encephalitozoon intestinalis ATCC 50506]|uniref:SWIM-type domain-containing protein n=1 Tax=Encephalitozoon intestinalis (strain ATCC 50506) TaxID=876142 RepID=E0S736_ENCIT|nr:uncharacterized protein Eint_050150 [Encephalitozoon intestinalis ATCC 50506]ADM11464.1 hypothetical protein Eint_050150 [Encephalitozoon intestinalis ATCC 50506]UTX45175.1 hypothetical protein GPK93_05g07190 [Encephalitozoon intestinalis]
MKGLSVNDILSTREEAEKALIDHAVRNNLNYDLEETPKSISVLCKGREEFGCDARIVAQLRKKDGVFVVKRIRLSHKCPVVTSKYGSPDEMVRMEVQKAIGDRYARIGEILSVLADMNIKMGYFSVWKAMRQNDKTEKENMEMICGEEGGKDELFGRALKEFSQEFLELNPCAVAHQKKKMFFFSFPEYLDVLVPIVEIRIYKRTEGFAMLGVLRDPTWSPIVYSCAVSDTGSRESTFEYFIDSMPKLFFLVDFDCELINILRRKERDFFVKTRDICKFYYNKNKSIDGVEDIWNKCNTSKEWSTPELNFMERKHYLKSCCETEMLGMQNTSECDAEFIGLGIFNLPFFDCVCAILKLSSDNLSQRKKASFGEGKGKGLFGNNVIRRIEKNTSVETADTFYDVDLQNQTCTCGKFQEFLIPCPHACKKILDSGEDPYLYVSDLYSKTRLQDLKDIIPVADLPVKCQSDRNLLKRGPGRPKKILVREPSAVRS